MKWKKKFACHKAELTGYISVPLTQFQNFCRMLGTRWVLSVSASNDSEHVIEHNDTFSFAMSICVRWFSLQFPSVKSLKKLKIFAANPVFFDRKNEPLPNRWVHSYHRSWVLTMSTVRRKLFSVNWTSASFCWKCLSEIAYPGVPAWCINTQQLTFCCCGRHNWRKTDLSWSDGGAFQG